MKRWQDRGQRAIEMERLRDGETERLRDRETERQKDGKTETEVCRGCRNIEIE
jgi:hypothetical protein